MTLELRPYQHESVDAVYAHLRAHDDNPVVVMPTGTGKSLVIARIASDAVTFWGGRVIVLAHVKELLEQNAEKLSALCPGLKIGVYSAGLRRRDTDTPILVAGIQSVYNRACELGRFDLAIVDEAHLIPFDGEGMYRTFLADARVVNPNLRVIGLTATPYRLQGGDVCRSDAILNSVCYEAGIREMIAQGWLARPRSVAGRVKVDLSGVSVRGGEFVNTELAEAMDRGSLVDAACWEIAELTRDRKSVLIFTASVDHCRHVAVAIKKHASQECGVITGDTPSDVRDELIRRFRGESVKDGLFGAVKPPLKFLANVNVLTTGFDATCVDTVAILRPTMSPGLYVQMVGRGTRIHPGKEDCLVLDYGGNVVRHGPVDAPKRRAERSPHSGCEPAGKECEKCHAVVACGFRVCPECAAEFPPPTSATHDATARRGGVMSDEATVEEIDIDETCYYEHRKRGAPPDHPPSMRVEYIVRLGESVSEWVCPEHEGFAREKFVKWWRERSYAPLPDTVRAAVDLARGGALAKTKMIRVRRFPGENFPKIIGYELDGEIPEAPEPGWNDGPGEMAMTAAYADEDIPF